MVCFISLSHFLYLQINCMYQGFIVTTLITMSTQPNLSSTEVGFDFAHRAPPTHHETLNIVFFLTQQQNYQGIL